MHNGKEHCPENQFLCELGSHLTSLCLTSFFIKQKSVILCVGKGPVVQVTIQRLQTVSSGMVHIWITLLESIHHFEKYFPQHLCFDSVHTPDSIQSGITFLKDIFLIFGGPVICTLSLFFRELFILPHMIQKPFSTLDIHTQPSSSKWDCNSHQLTSTNAQDHPSPLLSAFVNVTQACMAFLSASIMPVIHVLSPPEILLYFCCVQDLVFPVCCYLFSWVVWDLRIGLRFIPIRFNFVKISSSSRHNKKLQNSIFST